jgi:hypothetical protein
MRKKQEYRHIITITEQILVAVTSLDLKYRGSSYSGDCSKTYCVTRDISIF